MHCQNYFGVGGGGGGGQKCTPDAFKGTFPFLFLTSLKISYCSQDTHTFCENVLHKICFQLGICLAKRLISLENQTLISSMVLSIQYEAFSRIWRLCDCTYICMSRPNFKCS